MTKTKKIDQTTRQIADALLSAAKSLEAAANIMIGADAAVKMEKVPDAPKRNINSYMLYAKETWERVAQEHPMLPLREIAKLMGGKWNALTAEEKRPYVDRAKADRVRYDREMVEYRQEKGLPVPSPASSPAPSESSGIYYSAPSEAS